MDAKHVKPPPHSPESEVSLCGAAILDPLTIPSLRKVVSPDDFFLVRYRTLWESICGMADRGAAIDLVLVKDELVKRDVLDKIGGVTALAECVQSTPSASNGIAYAQSVVSFAARRNLMRLSLRAAKKIESGEELNGDLDELAQAGKASIDIAGDRLEPSIPSAAVEGLDLGSPEWLLEPLIGKGMMTLLQGRPKAGKSTLALYAALMMAKGVWTADLFSILKPATGIYLHYEDALRRIKDRLERYNEPLMLGGLPSTLRLFQRPPRFDMASPEGPKILRKLIERDRADFVVIDTFAKCHSAEENSAKEMQPVMIALRDIILDYNIALVLVHHSKKSQNGDVTATSEKGRGSSVIAAEPDVIVDFGNRPAPNVTFCKVDSKEDCDWPEFNAHYQRQHDGSVKWLMTLITVRDDTIEVQNKIEAAITELYKTNREIKFSDIQAVMGSVPGQTLRDNLKAMSSKGRISKTKADYLPRKPFIYAPKVDLSGIIDPTD